MYKTHIVIFFWIICTLNVGIFVFHISCTFEVGISVTILAICHFSSNRNKVINSWWSKKIWYKTGVIMMSSVFDAVNLQTKKSLNDFEFKQMQAPARNIKTYPKYLFLHTSPRFLRSICSAFFLTMFSAVGKFLFLNTRMNKNTIIIF